LKKSFLEGQQEAMLYILQVFLVATGPFKKAPFWPYRHGTNQPSENYTVDDN